jgi:FixJ family two-component response regulator
LRRLSNKEIAGILGISERTVKFHVSNVFGKLQVDNRQSLPAAMGVTLGEPSSRNFALVPLAHAIG